MGLQWLKVAFVCKASQQLRIPTRCRGPPRSGDVSPQAFLDAFPAPGQPASALVAEAPLRALQEVTDVLIRLDRSSRARKAC